LKRKVVFDVITMVCCVAICINSIRLGRILKKAIATVKWYQKHYGDARDSVIRLQNGLEKWFTLARMLKNNPYLILKYGMRK
jgi:hypothetical protein